MSEKIKLVQGDNHPVIRLNLTNADGGTPLDVTNASVNVKFRAAGSLLTLSTLACTKVNTGSDGVVKFNFPGTTLDVPPGTYEGEVVIDFAGEKQTVYDTLKFHVRAKFA